MRITYNVLLLIILLHFKSAAQEAACAAIANSHGAVLNTFLAEQNPTRVSSCITPAIRQLGQARDATAVPVLIRYLDYVDPATSPRPDGGADVRPNYPAVTALFQIGQAATRNLLLAIQSGDSPKIQHNASVAYMLVYRDDLASGIHLLKQQQLSSKSKESRRNLTDALQLLLNDCVGRSEKERAACEDAAKNL